MCAKHISRISQSLLFLPRWNVTRLYRLLEPPHAGRRMQMNELIKLLGEENAKSIKDAITSALIDHIDEDFKQSDEFYVDFEEIETLMKSLTHDVVLELKDSIREKIKAVLIDRQEMFLKFLQETV